MAAAGGHHARMAAPVVDEHGEVWLDSATAALVLGFSVQYLGRLALAGRVPGRRDGTSATSPWRFRRRDIEQIAAARAVERLLDDHHQLPDTAKPALLPTGKSHA